MTRDALRVLYEAAMERYRADPTHENARAVKRAGDRVTATIRERAGRHG